jgi:hypothetical protein
LLTLLSTIGMGFVGGRFGSEFLPPILARYRRSRRHVVSFWLER